MTTLQRSSYDWAIKHLLREHDTDLFPLPFEIEVIHKAWADVVVQLEKLDVSNYAWRSGVRHIVPKAPSVFRVATQLEPLDSIVISALVYEFGGVLQDGREKSGCSHSHYFAPSSDGVLYAKDRNWRSFWEAGLAQARQRPGGRVVLLDISDCYNQVYHHVLDRYYQQCQLPKWVGEVLKRYVQAFTDKVSRGIPVGPHSSHLLAECALDPIDRSLRSSGYRHTRFVDDIHMFVDGESQVQAAIYEFTSTLDLQQKLVVQHAKTRDLGLAAYVALAEGMLINRPINDSEEAVLQVIAKNSGGDPYAEIQLSTLDDDDMALLDESVLSGLISAYLDMQPVDYHRLAWLIRRLTQVGAPGAVCPLLERASSMGPILGVVVRYLLAAVPNYEGDQHALGSRIVDMLDNPLIGKIEYLQMLIVSTLARLPQLNNADRVTARYLSAPKSVQRAILLAAGSCGSSDWLRARKTEFSNMDRWSRRALLHAAGALPGDEAKAWYDVIRHQVSPMEKLVAKLSLPSVNVGEIRLAVE